LQRKKQMDPREVTRLIQEGLETAHVEVRSDDGSHFAAVVVSDHFEGLRPIQRHQLVYKTLGERVGREIHALSIRALTSAEAGDSFG
jgi:acid stress-induced BolA-like protein IbaG/YrbA